MRANEAKDFLVSKIKQQAELDNVPLEGPEIQMLYFTEQGGVSEKMQEVADEFDSKYETTVYEKKIAGLMHGAYKRLKRECSPEVETWDAAIRTLKKGDHYILVMWGGMSWLSFLVVLGLVLAVIAMFAVINWLGQKFQPPNPRIIQIAFVSFVVLGYLFRNQLGHVLDALMDKTVMGWLKSEDKKNES